MTTAAERVAQARADMAGVKRQLRLTTSRMDYLRQFAKNYRLEQPEIVRRSLTAWNRAGRVALDGWRESTTRENSTVLTIEVPAYLLADTAPWQIAAAVAWHLSRYPMTPATQTTLPDVGRYRTKKGDE